MSLFLFILIFITLIIGELLRFTIIPGLVITPLDGLVSLLAIFWLGTHVIAKKPIHISFLKPIIFFVITCIISLLVNIHTLSQPHFLTAFLYIVRWAWYACIYGWVSEKSQVIKQKIPYIMIISGIVLAIGGFLQYGLYTNLINLSYLGWDRHWYRLFATFFDPNFIGAFFVLNFLLNFQLLINSFSEKRSIRSVVLFVALLIFLTAIFLTFSRSALIALFVGILVYFLFNKQHRRLSVIAFFIFLIGIGVVLLNYQATEGTKLFRELSSKARLDSMNTAITIFQKNPLLGVGFDAYRYAQYRYGFATSANWEISHSGAGTDNSFLFILATTGLLGFFSYMYMLFSFLKKTKQSVRTHSISLVTFASLCSIIVTSFFINALFYPSIMLWLWIVLGLIENNG